MLIVIPSVGYADFLAVTLPAWQAVAPGARIRVVTSREDADTLGVAAEAGVGCVVTDAWHRDGATFNKAAALDEAFEFTNPRGPADRWCLATDADVLPIGQLPSSERQTGALYGCPRYACDTPAQLAAFHAGELGLDAMPLLLPRKPGETAPHRRYRPDPEDVARASRAGLGYFQLFAWRQGLRFGSSLTAGGYDQRFAGLFSIRSAMPSIAVLHLGAQDRANWSGRVLPRWGTA